MLPASNERCTRPDAKLSAISDRTRIRLSLNNQIIYSSFSFCFLLIFLFCFVSVSVSCSVMFFVTALVLFPTFVYYLFCLFLFLRVH